MHASASCFGCESPDKALKARRKVCIRDAVPVCAYPSLTLVLHGESICQQEICVIYICITLYIYTTRHRVTVPNLPPCGVSAALMSQPGFEGSGARRCP